MRIVCPIVASLAIMLTALAHADVVVLDDGASLSGKLVRVTDATLVFRTTLKGQIMAPLDAVDGITTDSNLAVTFYDDSVRYGRLVYRSELQRLYPINGGDPTTIRLSDVVEAAVIPAATQSDDEDMRAWRASLSLGLRQGEQQTSVTRPEARLRVESELPKVTLRGDLRAAGSGGYAEDIGIAAELEGRGQGMSPFAGVSAEYDPERGLDLRTDLTLGVSKPFLENGQGSLTGMAGLNLTREDWDNRRIANVNRDSETDTDVNLRLRLGFQRNLTEDWEVRGALDVLPSLTDWGEFRARSEAELTYAVRPRLHLRFDLLLDYDSQPDIAGPDEFGASVGAGIQMDF